MLPSEITVFPLTFCVIVCCRVVELLKSMERGASSDWVLCTSLECRVPDVNNVGFLM